MNLIEIIALLNHRKQRATYGAVASYLSINTMFLCGQLGQRRPEVSWIVNRDNWEPTGYTENQKHPDLKKKPNVITSEQELHEFIAASR